MRDPAVILWPARPTPGITPLVAAAPVGMVACAAGPKAADSGVLGTLPPDGFLRCAPSMLGGSAVDADVHGEFAMADDASLIARWSVLVTPLIGPPIGDGFRLRACSNHVDQS